MGIERFTPAEDAERVRDCYEIYRTACQLDAPEVPFLSPQAFEGWLPAGWIGDPRDNWLMTDGDGVAGWYSLELPARDNRHRASVMLMVPPVRRRRGLGTALLRHATGRAQAGGRGRLNGFAQDGSPGERFARTAGATPGVGEIHRILDLASPGLTGRIAGLRAGAEPASAGYSLVSWDGPAPPQYLDQVAGINRALEDAPRDQGTEAQQWDGARVREAEKRVELQGVRIYTVAARRDSTGELGGFTQVEVNPEQPDQAFQALTAVVRAHRGHRLGLRLKLAMLDRLAQAEPQLQQMFTGNAEGNDHMIAINEALGYRVAGQPLRSWELALTQS